MESPLALTPEYATARDDFVTRARAAGAAVEHFAHPGVGPGGEDLAVDVAWLGPDDANAVVIVVAGTHGVEGFAGSALQRTWLRDRSPRRPDDVAVCLVHGLNPYGFAWVRRVNEDNVDLNRNFVDFSRPPTNPGYDALASLVVPETWDDATQEATTAALLAHAEEHGFAALQQAVSGGQYRHPTGVFYGGTGPVWSHHLLDSLCESHWGRAERLAIVDVHTGLGPWSVGELISSDAPDDPAHRRAVSWYGDDVTSLVAGDSVSAELAGEWLPHVAATCASAEVTAVALEFGTVDTVTVLQALRADAWLHAHGDPGSDVGIAIKAQLRAAFADDDPAWIAALWDRFSSVLAATFDGIGA